MGNHAVGNTVGPQAEVALRNRQPGETALDILDRLCEPWRGTDAEWESTDPSDPDSVHPEFLLWTDPHPKAALGLLMVEAFAPNGLADLGRYEAQFDADDPDEEAACEAWWEEVYEPFKRRYNFDGMGNSPARAAKIGM